MAISHQYELPDEPAPGLKIALTRVGDLVVCSLAGDVHMDHQAAVGQALNKALAWHPALLVVDLSAVELFTSTGLNALITVRRTAPGTPLVLAAPSTHVLHVLNITQTDRLFPIYPTVEQALDQQAGPGPTPPAP
ncbi:STAS domain-containing protein [Kitasatospora sp. NPDC059571]|uniref:STAS domain-containing protein n=1 Tax=Kitasatospora sp. NPDC059571 TaxID=3346871 RepID=UPI0036C607FE